MPLNPPEKLTYLCLLNYILTECLKKRNGSNNKCLLWSLLSLLICTKKVPNWRLSSHKMKKKVFSQTKHLFFNSLARNYRALHIRLWGGWSGGVWRMIITKLWFDCEITWILLADRKGQSDLKLFAVNLKLSYVYCRQFALTKSFLQMW